MTKLQALLAGTSPVDTRGGTSDGRPPTVAPTSISSDVVTVYLASSPRAVGTTVDPEQLDLTSRSSA